MQYVGMDTPFAVFVLAPSGAGTVAATTRAADRGEAGRIGLPGGKVDAGEDPRVAALRESAEEGWLVSGLGESPAHVALVEGRPVWWYRADSAVAIADGRHKEAGRVEPVSVTLDAVAASGYGNEWVRS